MTNDAQLKARMIYQQAEFLQNLLDLSMNMSMARSTLAQHKDSTRPEIQKAIGQADALNAVIARIIKKGIKLVNMPDSDESKMLLVDLSKLTQEDIIELSQACKAEAIAAKTMNDECRLFNADNNDIPKTTVNLPKNSGLPKTLDSTAQAGLRFLPKLILFLKDFNTTLLKTLTSESDESSKTKALIDSMITAVVQEASNMNNAMVSQGENKADIKNPELLTRFHMAKSPSPSESKYKALLPEQVDAIKHIFLPEAPDSTGGSSPTPSSSSGYSSISSLGSIPNSLSSSLRPRSNSFSGSRSPENSFHIGENVIDSAVTEFIKTLSSNKHQGPTLG